MNTARLSVCPITEPSSEAWVFRVAGSRLLFGSGGAGATAIGDSRRREGRNIGRWRLIERDSGVMAHNWVATRSLDACRRPSRFKFPYQIESPPCPHSVSDGIAR